MVSRDLHERDRAFTVFGGSVLVAFGLVGIFSSGVLGSITTLSTGQFLGLWAETILALVFGFLAILAGPLLASENDGLRATGALLGIFSSLIGVIMVMLLLMGTEGLTSGISISGQMNLSFSMLTIGAIVVLFVGFPLSLAGSVGGLQGNKPEDEQET